MFGGNIVGYSYTCSLYIQGIPPLPDPERYVCVTKTGLVVGAGALNMGA